MVQTCPRCAGAGQVITNPCATCHGSGRVERRRTLKVNIPAGIEDGTRLRVVGEGEGGRRSGPSGDLYVVVQVKPDERFVREGPDLHLEHEVSALLAALGTEVEAPTLEGAEKVSIPAGTQHGDTVVLRGKGLPRLRRGGHGDLVIHVKVVVPRRLSSRQRELLAAVVAEEERPSVFRKVRDLLEGNG
jgi:molecular chaperone DnaJ